MCSPIYTKDLPEECKYIEFPSLGYFLYNDPKSNIKKCFAISNDSKE